MTRVVIGANGQLGADLLEVLQQQDPGCRTIGLTHDEIEISDAEAVTRALSQAQPDWVINTAAFHNVVRCEEQPDRAFAVNARGAWHLARTCAELGAGLVHVSTDYVFDGEQDQPYGEEDLPGPLNVYGVTKLAGEHLIRATLPRHLIVRSCGLYGVHPCRAKLGESFVDTMLRLARERGEVRVVDDQRVTPTCTLDLARQIAALLPTSLRGVVHATSGGECSWYDFAREIFSICGIDVRMARSRAADFGGPVKRPASSVLANRRLAEAGLDRMRPWQEALRDYLGRRGLGRDAERIPPGPERAS